MPLSAPTSSYLQDLARRRAIEEELGQRMQGAASTLTQGVSTLYGQQRQGAADQREAARLKLAQDTAAAEGARAEERLSLDRSGQAATQANAAANLALAQGRDARDATEGAARLDLAKHADERAASEAAAHAQDAAKKEARTRVDAVVRPLMDDPNVGPKAALDQAISRIAGQPGFETITPDDVIRAHHDYLIEINEKARATGRQDAADEAKDLAEKDRVRHEKEMESQGRAGLAIDRERIAAGKESAAAKAEGKGAKLSPADEKRRTTVQEIEGRREAIKRNVAALKEIVKNTGTVELTGPESAQREQLLNEIATDMAKLADPNSVARPSEVEQARKGLLPQGRWDALVTSDATAQQILDSALKNADARAMEAYRIHGITPDASGQVGAPAAPPGTSPAPSSDFVVVTDGKETRRIARSDLAEARADGYVEVR